MSTNRTVSRKLRIIIIGAGMSGILAAIRIKEAGKHDFVVLEKTDRIGGTWRENTYPGLFCDVPAHAYTYSFAPNPDWSSFLAPGYEIQAYFENVVRQFNIGPSIRFGQTVKSTTWKDGQWDVVTEQGECLHADVVIAASGVLHHPSLPDIAGLDRFEGAKFHTARWDHSVTLEGQRIGIIGNGSTGVQIVSALAGRVKKLVHFQRSPQWIMPFPNQSYSAEQKAAFRANPALIDDIRYGEHYLGLVRRFTEAIIDESSPIMAEIEAAVLKNLEDSVRDPVLREKLRPRYRAACKRLIYSGDYYEKAQHPSVEIETGGIAEVDAKGVRMHDGSRHDIDVLVLATGFKANMFMRPMHVTGSNGAELDKYWTPDPSAYLGILMPDFPNLFLLNGPTGPVGNFSLIDIAESQWTYVANLIERLESGQCQSVSVSGQVMDDYNQRRQSAAKKTIFASGCKSWYLDSAGVPASWPWSYEAFVSETAAPRDADLQMA